MRSRCARRLAPRTSTTSTPTAPRRRQRQVETEAIKTVFGEHADRCRQLHQVDDRAPARRGRGDRGASARLAIGTGCIPPTINYETPTPPATWTTSRTSRRDRCDSPSPTPSASAATTPPCCSDAGVADPWDRARRLQALVDASPSRPTETSRPEPRRCCRSDLSRRSRRLPRSCSRETAGCPAPAPTSRRPSW